jgi:hypothetical protein
MRAALFPYVWRHGEQCHGVDGRPGESSPAEASWCVLCSYRSGLEGGGIVVGRLVAVVGRFEGAVDGGAYVAQWQSWRRLVPARPNSVGMSPQCLAWCGSGGDGRTGLTATGMTDPAGLTPRVALRNHRKDIRGCCRPPFEGLER